MIKSFAMVAAVGMLASATAPAHAAAFNGAAKIARGDFRGAERDIVAQRALYPDDIDLMLNLAAVYANTGRPEKARALYARIAGEPDQEVTLRNGSSVWSHAVATRSLVQPAAAIVATR